MSWHVLNKVKLTFDGLGFYGRKALTALYTNINKANNNLSSQTIKHQYTFEKTKGEIKNKQSRDTDNIRHTGRRTLSPTRKMVANQDAPDAVPASYR